MSESVSLFIFALTCNRLADIIMPPSQRPPAALLGTVRFPRAAAAAQQQAFCGASAYGFESSLLRALFTLPPSRLENVCVCVCVCLLSTFRAAAAQLLCRALIIYASTPDTAVRISYTTLAQPHRTPFATNSSIADQICWTPHSAPAPPPRPTTQPKHDSHSDAIRQFEGDYECLSNTYKCLVSLRGDPEPYPSVEVIRNTLSV